jgi:hypothetical protein
MVVVHIAFMTGFRTGSCPYPLVAVLRCQAVANAPSSWISIDCSLMTGDAVGIAEETMRWLDDAMKLGSPPRIRFKNRCAGFLDFASWHQINV